MCMCMCMGMYVCVCARVHVRVPTMLQARLGRTDGSVDLLITGCEVSLWLGEQFAADVHLAFPKLKVVIISRPDY